MDINDYLSADEIAAATGKSKVDQSSPPEATNIVKEMVDEWTTLGGGNNPYRPMAMNKMEAERQSQDETLLGRYTAELYDPMGTFRSGFADWTALQDIARSTSPVDKISKFKDYFPDANVRMENINGKNILLAKDKTATRWTKIDDSFLSFPNLFAGTVSGAEIGAGVGEIAGGKLGGPIGGIITGPLGSAAGYLLGTVADKSLEYLRGYRQEEGLLPETSDIFTAAAGAGLSFIGRPTKYVFDKASDYLSGVDEIAPTPEIISAIETAKKNNLPPVTRGAAALGGVMKSQYSQALSVSSYLYDEAIKRPIAARQNLLDKIKKFGVDNASPAVIKDVLDRTALDLDALLSSIKSGHIDINDAGNELDGLFKNWEDVNDARVNKLYNDFRKAYGDDISFDLTNITDRKTGTVYNLQTEVKKLLTGATLKGADRTVTIGTTVPAGMPSAGLGFGTTPPVGGAITKTVSDDVKVSLEPDGALAKLMLAVTKLDPIVTPYTTKAGGTTTAFDGIKELRTGFRKLMESTNPQERFLAAEMHSKMNDVIDSVIVNTGDPADTLNAMKDWKTMSKEYKTFMETKDISTVHKIEGMDATQRADLAASLIRPGKYESVKLVSELLGANGKETLRSMFFSKLTAGQRLGSWENTVSKTLDSFAKQGDNKTIEYLFSPDEITTLKQWGAAKDKLENSSLRVYTEDTTAAANAIKLASSGDTGALMELTSLTVNSPEIMDSIRAGFLQHLVDASSVQVPKYGQQMHIKKYDDIIQNYTNNGSLEVLFPDKDQREFITKGMRDYISITGTATGLGTSLQTGELASTGADVIVKVPTAILQGKGEKAAGIVAKTLALTLPQRTLGRWFLKEAELQGTGVTRAAAGVGGKTIKGVSNIIDAAKKLGQFAVYFEGYKGTEEMQQYSPAAFNQAQENIYQESVRSEKEKRQNSPKEINKSMNYSPTLF